MTVANIAEFEDTEESLIGVGTASGSRVYKYVHLFKATSMSLIHLSEISTEKWYSYKRNQ